MSQGFTKGAAIDTDGTLSANSDFLIPSQKAVKTYVDTEIAAVSAVSTVTDNGSGIVDNTDPTNPIIDYEHFMYLTIGT